MTSATRHTLRLLKWGRTLAKHGALQLIEQGVNTPAPVKRLCRIARFGTFQPATPDYATAFKAIGPAAVKLGQTLATRPDLVGEEAARNLKLAQRVDDEHPQVLVAEGHVAQLGGRSEDALRCFTAAVKADPNYADANYWVGMANLNGGNMPEAIKYFENYLKLAPTGAMAAQAKGVLDSIKPKE